VLLLVGLLLAPGATFLPVHDRAGSAPSTGARALTSGACPGASMRKANAGSLEEAGDFPSIAAVGNVGLVLWYEIQVKITNNGGGSSTQCSSEGAVFTTASNGTFSVNASVPISFCARDTCTTYTGPFLPAYFELGEALPLGYYFNGSYAVGSVDAEHPELVAALQDLTLAPAGPLVLSAEAPTPITLHATDARGDPSPATLAINWSVSSIAWHVTPGTGANMIITPPSGGSTVAIAAYVNATYNGSSLPMREVGESATSIATDAVFGSPSSTRVDAGSPVVFSLLGTGAGGYPYTEILYPGFNASPVSAPCASTAGLGGSVNLACDVTYAYRSTGPVVPGLVLTNGYSSSLPVTLGTLTIAAALELTVNPDPVRMYVDTPTAVTIGVVAGTGTEPYGPACLTTLAGGLNCSSSPGSSWTFDLRYPEAGTYHSEFTVLDAAGTNESLAIPITVGERPSLASLTSGSNTVNEYATVGLAADVSGGVGPFTYWWNASSPAGTIGSGSVPDAGVINGSYTPTAPGPQVVSLTVVDALGTVVAGSLELLVIPGPPTTLVPAEGPTLAAPATAGMPDDLAWAVLAPSGDRVSDFAGPVALTFESMPEGAGPILLAPFRGGAETLGSSDAFDLGSSEWQSGYLNFSLTFTRSGVYTITLATGLTTPLAPGSLLAITVLADPLSLALVDPEVALAGARENHTRWTVVDAYGNPGPSGSLNLTEWFGGSSISTRLPIATDGITSWTWINFSAPGSSGGTFEVRSSSGQLLLGPITVPAAPAAPASSLGWILLAAGLFGGTLAAAVVVRRRPRPSLRSAEVGAEELEAYARGREDLLTRLREEGPLDLPAILGSQGSNAAHRAEVAEWLASLTTEGLVTSEAGPRGHPRFRAAPVVAPSHPQAPRVDVDPDALERALRERER
jgi:hypothetical protein